jgi:hypothetical protein
LGYDIAIVQFHLDIQNICPIMENIKAITTDKEDGETGDCTYNHAMR